VDLARWVAGDAEEVMVYANKCTSLPEFPLLDDYIGIFKFKNGCVGKVWVTAGIRRIPEHVVNFNAYGSEGSIETNTLQMQARVWFHWQVPGQSDAMVVPFQRTVGHPVLEELKHFVECIRTGKTPLVDVTEGAKTVATLEAGLRSVESGKPEKVAAVA